MGQKTHPIGLRIGIYRKWASSWYGDLNQPASQQAFGVIASRGGSYLSGIEDLLTNIFKRYSVTKFTKTPRILLVDFRLFKGFGGHRYGFMVYTKLLMRKLFLGKHLSWIYSQPLLLQNKNKLISRSQLHGVIMKVNLLLQIQLQLIFSINIFLGKTLFIPLPYLVVPMKNLQFLPLFFG